MRKLVLTLAFGCLATALVHCVDDVSSQLEGSDVDASSVGDGSLLGTDDGSPPLDGSSTDSSTPIDASPPVVEDQCVGHTDCPKDISAANLRLWLRANIGVTCTADHVTTWADQSAAKDNATPGTHANGTVAQGPQCAKAKIAGHDVLSFTAPDEPDGGDAGMYTQYVDETLNVDLSFVNASSYTLFVVHRRASDVAAGLVGQDLTVVPSGGYHFSACLLPNPPHDAFFLSLEGSSDGARVLEWTHRCSYGLGSRDTYRPSHADLDEVVYSTTTGHELYTNGEKLYDGDGGTDDTTAVTTNTHQGIIGRAENRYRFDTRFRGDIAEIIGYNTALDASQRALVEAYLKRQWELDY